MVDDFNVLSKGYLVLSDGTNIQVLELPGNTTVTTDTGRGGPSPSTVYSGTNVASAKAAETLP